MNSRLSKTYKKIYGNWRRFDICPVCRNKSLYVDKYYGDAGMGLVEVHGDCYECGYVIEKGYSPTIEGYRDITKGFKRPDGVYVPKDVKRHKRHRRKHHANKKLEVNPIWVFYL